MENTPSRKLLLSPRFSEVGDYEKHARLDSTRQDEVLVELLIPSNLGPWPPAAPSTITDPSNGMFKIEPERGDSTGTGAGASKV